MKPEELLKHLTPQQKASLVCGKDFWHSQDIPSLNIDSLVFSDGPNGLRYQAHKSDHLGLNGSVKATCFPTSSALASSWDEELACMIGKAMGQEAAALECDVLLGPGINLIRNPAGGRNFEYFCEDPLLTGRLAASQIKGIQKYVSACPKHFLLNSQETDRQSVDEYADEKTLHELYLPAFERVIQQSQPDWIMTAYNKVFGQYASESPRAYQLLKELGHEGAIVTDWGGGNQIVQAVQQGSSLEMPGTFKQSEKEILEALANGTLEKKDLDARVLEVLQAMKKAQFRRLRSKAFLSKMAKQQALQGIPYNARHHHLLAIRAAAASAVLLKNDGILPLKDQKTAWIGPISPWPIQGGGSSKVEPSKNLSLQQACLQDHLPLAGMARGYSLESYEPSGLLEEEALKLALDPVVDVIVFVAVFPEQEQLEGLDRRMLCLPPNQVSLYTKLFQTGKPVILIDAIAGAVEIPDHEKFAAIVYTGLAGQGALEGLLRILTGQTNPSGRLAITFANSWKDHPSSACFPAKKQLSLRPEGMHVGYRAFLDKDVLYPFGYGLSYTTFSFEQPYLALSPAFREIPVQKEGSVSMAQASKDHPQEAADPKSFSDRPAATEACPLVVEGILTNIGKMAGAYVLQVYVQKPGTDYRELAGFVKVNLQPSQSRRVSIPIEKRLLESYDPERKKWSISPGLYLISAADNARDLLHTWKVEPIESQKTSMQPTTMQKTAAQLPVAASDESQASMLREESSRIYGMDTPLHDFCEAPGNLLPTVARLVVKGKEHSLKRLEPNMLLISLADMPLKGLGKVSARFMSPALARSLLKEAQKPGKESLLAVGKSLWKQIMGR